MFSHNNEWEDNLDLYSSQFVFSAADHPFSATPARRGISRNCKSLKFVLCSIGFAIRWIIKIGIFNPVKYYIMWIIIGLSIHKSHSYFTFIVSFLSVHLGGAPEPPRWTVWTTKVEQADHLRGPLFLIPFPSLIIVFCLFWLYCHIPNLYTKLTHPLFIHK